MSASFSAAPDLRPCAEAPFEAVRDLVSVIIPAFNVERWIASALRSVAAQTHDSIEIVVIDDGSSDATVRVAEQLLATVDKPSILLRHAHRGVSAARNAGWRAARGEWLQFLDADDMLAPEKLETQLRAARRAPHAALIYSAWQRVVGRADHVEAIEAAHDPRVDGKPALALAVGKHCIHPGSLLVKRSAVQSIHGFDEGMAVWEDIEFLLRLKSSGIVFEHAQADAPQYLYRTYPEQARWGGAGARYRLRDVASIWLEMVEGFPVASLDELNEADRRELLSDATTYLRLLYKQDRPAFHTFLKRVRRLEPSFVPQSPPWLRMLARGIGYEHAERATAVAKSLLR